MCADERVPTHLSSFPCAAASNPLLSSVFETLASQTPNALFIAIDAEALPDISENYEVAAVPYFVLLRNNEILTKLSGADPASLASAIATHSGSSGSSLPPAQSTVAPPAPADAPPNEEDDEEEEEEDLNTRLKKLVSAAPVMLFMKGTPAAPQCGFSRQLVGLLRERSVRYGFFNILADDEVRQGLKAFSDWPTYPQLYVDGELVGGLDIVKEEIEANPEFLKGDAATE
jgi:Grx4 family monothiol glutaredoxin